MPKELSVISFSVFKGSPFGHGGNKRSNQLELLIKECANFETVTLPIKYNSDKRPPFLNQLLSGDAVSKVMRATNVYKKKFSPVKLLDESHKYQMNEKVLEKNKDLVENADTVMWECTFPEFAYLPILLKQKFSKKVLACPHNLEALIPAQKQRWYGRDRYDFLEQEIESFSKCDEIFTISEEDQWLLNLFGLRAKYLPFYPIGELHDFLIDIRTFRTKNVSDDYFLIVGSVINPPTKIGMMNLLCQLNELRNRKVEIPVVVVGFGTESLSNEFRNNPLIKIVGSAHEKTLSELMKNCKGAIINQGFSSGVLTKIPEFLISGIPVIVDEGGSRSFKRYDGVHVFRNMRDLDDISFANLKMPTIPAPPTVAFKSFQDSLKGNSNVTSKYH